MHMSEQIKGDDAAAIQALSVMLDQSMKSMEVTNDTQEIAILGAAAIVACLADTGKIPTDRLAAIVGLLTLGRHETYRKQVTDFVSLAVTVAKRLPEAVAAHRLAAAPATRN
jgi:hypothetical protein